MLMVTVAGTGLAVLATKNHEPVPESTSRLAFPLEAADACNAAGDTDSE